METYKDYQITTYYIEKFDMNWYEIWKNNLFVSKDWGTLAGDKITDLKQAINEAKRTIDTWIRLKLV